MAYVVRFVQRFRPSKEKQFLALEREFARLERRRPGLPRGRRLRPFAPFFLAAWTEIYEVLEL